MPHFSHFKYQNRIFNFLNVLIVKTRHIYIKTSKTQIYTWGTIIKQDIDQSCISVATLCLLQTTVLLPIRNDYYPNFSSNHFPGLPYSSLIYFGFELYMKEMILYVLFCIWALLRNTISLQSTHLVPVATDSLLWNISLNEYKTIYFSSLLLMNIWVYSNLGLFQATVIILFVWVSWFMCATSLTIYL